MFIRLAAVGLLFPIAASGVELNRRQLLGGSVSAALARKIPKVQGPVTDLAAQMVERRQRLSTHPLLGYLVSERFEDRWRSYKGMLPQKTFEEGRRMVDLSRQHAIDDLIGLELDLAKEMGLSWDQVRKIVDSLFYVDFSQRHMLGHADLMRKYIEAITACAPETGSLFKLQYEVLVREMARLDTSALEAVSESGPEPSVGAKAPLQPSHELPVIQEVPAQACKDLLVHEEESPPAELLSIDHQGGVEMLTPNGVLGHPPEKMYIDVK